MHPQTFKSIDNMNINKRDKCQAIPINKPQGVAIDKCHGHLYQYTV